MRRPVSLNRVFYLHLSIGGAIAEAVSRWLPTAAARVRARVWQVEFVVDKMASGQVFSEYFGFNCQNRSFHQLLHPHNHPERRYNKAGVAAVPSEHCIQIKQMHLSTL
jgi:hypothetical protein